MKNHLKKALSILTVASITASLVSVPVIAGAADTYTPLVEGDTVINEWKLDFGSADDVAEGYTAVTPDMHPIMSEFAEGETKMGFLGTYWEDYKLTDRYDGMRMVKGHITDLHEGGKDGLNDAIGSVGAKNESGAAEEGTNGFQYPVRFAMYVDNGTYYRVRATVTTLDPTKPADATLYSERKHPLYTHKTIEAGESYTVDFSADIESIYYQKSDPTGLFDDDMLNITLAGENAAISSLIIQQVEPSTTLWVLGDSTVTDGGSTLPYFELRNYTGVGSGLSKYLRSDIAVSNQGEGGLSATDNYHFNVVKDRIKAGDYMYVEYGHNHKNDGVSGYLNSLDKYYQACKAAGATLVLVGPIDRHNTYNSTTNTWSTSLGQFSIGAKGYVDCMLWGGESAANEYVNKYKSGGEEAAEAYKKTVLEGNKTSNVTNVAFVDLNQPSLDWFSEITEKGTIKGEELKNDARLIDYYFTTAKGGSTDGTHPNDAGAQALAQFFFTNAKAKIDEYPALKGLLTKSNGEIPEDDETPTGEKWTRISQTVLDGGYAGAKDNPAWPDAVSQYEYAAKIKNANFNSDGKLESVDVKVQDNSLMPTYGRGVFAVYNSDGSLAQTALSNQGGGEQHVDNSTGAGVQTLYFEDSDIAVGEDQTFKVFLWSMKDDAASGYPLEMTPYTDGTYTPAAFDYLVDGEDGDVPETFQYYGYKDGATVYAKNEWSYGSGMNPKTNYVQDEDYWYGSFEASKANTSYRKLNEKFKDGIIKIEAEARLKSTNAVAEFGFAGYYKEKEEEKLDTNAVMSLLKINNDGSVTDSNGGNAGVVSADEWTKITYTMDLNKGTSSLQVGDGIAVENTVPEFSDINASNIPVKESAYFMFKAGSGLNLDLRNLSVVKVRRKEKLPKFSASASYTADSSEEMGTVSVSSQSVEQGKTVTYTASNNPGFRFDGWYTDREASGSPIATEKSFEAKILADTTVYAKFVKHEGFYLDDNFEDYSTDVKIAQTGNEATSAPDPITVGNFTLYAGWRNNGSASSKVYAKISSETSGDTENKYLEVSSDGYSTNKRGAKFTLNTPITLEDKADNKPVVWEFDTKVSNSGMTLTTDIGIYTAASTAGLDTGEWVNVKLIFDKAAKKQYFVVSDMDGKVLNITTKDLAENTSITGAEFYDGTTGTVFFDNMKIYDLGSPNTSAVLPKLTKVNAPAKTVVTIAGNTYTVDESGSFEIGLFEGDYNVSASCNGYEDYLGTITVDSSYEITVPIEQKTSAKASVTVNYVNEDGEPLKDFETISAVDGVDLYVGDEFTLVGEVYTAAIKLANADNESLYDVYTYNSDLSDSFTIEELQGDDIGNTINIVFTKLEGEYLEYEDFANVTDTWGFTEGNRGNVTVENGSLVLFKNAGTSKQNPDVKELAAEISSSSNLTVSFDWKSDSDITKTRYSTFELRDSSDNVIFSLFGGGKNGTTYALNKVAESSDTKIAGTSDKWIGVTLTIDFENKTIEGSLVNKDTNEVTTIESSPIDTAENLAKISVTYGYSAAPQYLDNFSIK